MMHQAGMLRIEEDFTKQLVKEMADSMNHLQEQMEALELKMVQLEAELQDYIDDSLDELELDDEDDYTPGTLHYSGRS